MNSATTVMDIGSKAKHLNDLLDLGYQVPTFQVVTVQYFLDNVLRDLAIDDADAIHRAIDEHQFDPDYITDLLSHFSSEINLFSVRSSVRDEDGEEHSFAGLFSSYLNVSKDAIATHIKRVWKSAWSDQVMTYMQMRDLTFGGGVAVIIQEMIQPSVSGVAFGANVLLTQKADKIITSSYGLGEGIVTNQVNVDTYIISDGEVIDQCIGDKKRRLVSDLSGNRWEEVPKAIRMQSSLSTENIHYLIEVLDRLEEYYGMPQDVEFAVFDQIVYLLQSRPITTTRQQPQGEKTIWDNSNIVESYPGITSPLTFSFIRKMYEKVYVQLASLLGVSDHLIEQNYAVYQNMLGLHHGRVYYNLMNWYRALSMLPGYTLNAKFMEKMMGVKQSLDLEADAVLSKHSARLALIKSIVKILVAYVRLPRETKQFHQFVDATITNYRAVDLQSKSLTALLGFYTKLEKILSDRWTPPLVNDLFAMIIFGLLQKKIAQWNLTDNINLHNDLVSGSGDIISVAPIRMSYAIARMIRSNEMCHDLFKQQDAATILNHLGNDEQYADVKAKIDEYIDTYGDRCSGELKLETITYRQMLSQFIEILKSCVANLELVNLKDDDVNPNRQRAEQGINQTLKHKPIRRWLINYLIRKSRTLISNRENLRFERTRSFGLIRSIFVAMGRKLALAGYIKHERDIFYLTKEEIFGFIQGTTVHPNLIQLIDSRKQIYDDYNDDMPLPDRFTTYDIAYGQHYDPLIHNISESNILQGTPCYGGIVSAKAHVVNSPSELTDLGGDVLIAFSTDPGWTTLFPTASAIIVERGSLLSHSAIVARELGIPCIVGVNHLLSKIKTGDELLINADTGIIKIIDNGHEQPSSQQS